MCWKNKQENNCSHNWVHNAGKQCKWSAVYSFKDCLNGLRPKDVKGDSKETCYFYICTMCGEEYWSSCKTEKIPHYRVRTVKKKERKQIK